MRVTFAKPVSEENFQKQKKKKTMGLCLIYICRGFRTSVLLSSPFFLFLGPRNSRNGLGWGSGWQYWIFQTIFQK